MLWSCCPLTASEWAPMKWNIERCIGHMKPPQPPSNIVKSTLVAVTGMIFNHEVMMMKHIWHTWRSPGEREQWVYETGFSTLLKPFLTFQEPWPNRRWRAKLLRDIEGNINWKEVRHAPWPEGLRDGFLKLASDINLIASKG